MGAIVLQRQGSSSSEVERRLVVDGQQRLTTLQLLLKAIQNVLVSQNDSSSAGRLRNLTVNPDNYLGGDATNQTKIRQSNINDQDAFQKVITDYQNQRESSSIFSAYSFLKNKVHNWLDQDVESWTNRAEAIERAVTERIQIAVIDLDEEEEPHTIFETLNERGEPLTQSDRIKNTVMYGARVTDDAVKAREIWGMFEDEWWRSDTKEGKLSRKQGDRFLNYWTLMKAKRDITAERVAAEFRAYIRETHQNDANSIENLAAQMRTAGLVYRQVEQENYSKHRIFLRRIKIMEIGVVTPFLLWLFTSNVPEGTVTRCLSALESYLVRRMVCGLASTGLNRVFLEFLQELDDIEISQLDTRLISFLRGKNVDNRQWPTDRMVREKMTSGPLPGNSSRQRMVLHGIEIGMRTGMSESLVDNGELTVEHLIPQKWEENWQIPEATPEAIELRNAAVKEIGNLTLITGKLNSSASNGPWEEKREALSEHSTLMLNKKLLESSWDAWTEADIRNRSRTLADIFLSVWPYADLI